MLEQLSLPALVMFFGRLVSGAQKLQSEGPGSSPGRRSFFWKERKQKTIGPSN